MFPEVANETRDVILGAPGRTVSPNTDAPKGPIMSTYQIPVIDLADLQCTGRAKIGQEIAQACESFGFFQVVNHGVDVNLMHKLREVSKGFFHLPDEEKEQYRKTPDNIQGYAHSNIKAGENKLNLASNDFFYFLSPMSKRREDLWPRDPPEFRQTMRQYAKEAKELAERLLSVMSEMLGLPPETLQVKLQGPTGEATYTIRANFYLPSRTEEIQVGLGCHSDPGGITLLLQDDAPGLQVKFNDEWIPVQPLLDGFCINCGDQIEILSNGRFKSIEHRGMACRDRERMSIPFFYNPAFDHVIAPLEELVDDAHPALYNGATYEHYFFNVFVKRGVGSGKQYIKETRV
ncbi:protein MpDOXC19 [Marchantia polymorpha subsp. ruderalis]|uniref:Fe2OG dioxygenase domain-containing protein n=2 Tax=Marchantia polymorpha TaxID=3197 RepID=A0A176VUH7_MARPO|nr:hypothetical protein AXG93_1615s1130 [Marchantia polymorpha subsp. ruderalis]PTQ40616.1 hypothetical protein MARPO_0039s0103 [Marchantia polymorpha]BBN05909.1 hypothetical protein Mp_3g16920 [Marchantia polymorpha subsp. ruderalis]|eukprot:PTQ40616.1 hypothetical protein MARPO_0039s0103 [Marchantia polymorpha]